jgi:DNA-binding CsgD family transcriptional regulator/tetratricopeptide (TPR) repeat protein
MPGSRPDPGLIQSPVLVGRDDFLGVAQRRLAEAAGGDGQLLLIAGEAGIGKTRLLGAIARHAQLTNFAVARAAAFPGDLQSSAGLLLALAGDLIGASEPTLNALGRNLSARLRTDSQGRGDAHHRRRLLVQDLVDLLVSPEPGIPVLIVLEDLHWADQLSLDVLGHLAGRLRTRSILVAGAYRSDELQAELPLRALRSRLLAQRLAEEIKLPRLGLGQITTLTSVLLGRPAPTEVIEAIHERTDGIPLHVEELLAALDEEALTPSTGAVVRAVAVPDTLGEAVLSRAQRLSGPTRAVASAAAVIGRSFDFDLLAAVTEVDPALVAGALRELREAHLVLPGTDAVTFDFRHALIRDALYADTDLPLRRRLHEQVARSATDRGYSRAFVSAHLELAQRGDLAYGHALTAGHQAAALSAHREALELYRRAARNAPNEIPASDRAALLTALGDEAAATDDNLAAADAYRSAHQLITSTGDARAAASLGPRMAAVAHLLGDGIDARVGMLQKAMDSLDGVAGAERERAQLRSAMAAAYMLDRRLDEAIHHGERGRAESQRIGDDEAALNTATTHGTVLVFAGRMDEGWPLLEGSIARARDLQLESEAARGYRMLGSCASVLLEYDRAERSLTDGVQYAEDVELWNHRHYMAAHLAHVQWATGRWDEANETAQQALADGRGGITTRITAQYILGYLALGRGDWGPATSLLREANAAGEQMAELQRFSPPLWGLAEIARCRGEFDTSLMLCERGYQASAGFADAAYLFPYLLTGVRSHLGRGDVEAGQEWSNRVGAILSARSIPGTLPAIEHARGLVLLAHGDVSGAQQALRSAATSWRARRRFWEGTWAGLDLAAVAAKARRRGEAARLIDDVRVLATAVGATPILDAADRLAGQLDRGRPPDPWYPLSAREFEVARLVSGGLTNRQIADRLVLSPKTISAHIEHILTKLDAARRAEIATWCTTVRPD